MIAKHYDELEAQDADLADFAEGFGAGYRAKSEHRAVLGSPSYRLGHAEGVQAAVERRRARRVDQLYDARQQQLRRFIRAVLFGLVLGLLFGYILVRSARADTLADWRMLNEVCQGSTGAVSDKACQQRPRAASQLRREGWFQGEHGVWVSPEHVATFTRIMRAADARARENIGMIDTIMQSLMTELRSQLPPEAIFALWNGRAGDLLARTPCAASMLMYGLPYLERMLSGRNDPRFRMVLRP